MFNRKQPLIEVPRPSQSLDQHLFQPESPEDVPVYQDNVVVNGPNVVVEPSYQMEEDLEIEFKNQNMETVNRLFQKYYSGNGKCPMMRKLVNLITTCQLYKNNEENPLSPGEIVYYILLKAVDETGIVTFNRRKK